MDEDEDQDHTTPEAGPSTLPSESQPQSQPPEKPRGRKRVRSAASIVSVYASRIFIFPNSDHSCSGVFHSCSNSPPACAIAHSPNACGQEHVRWKFIHRG